MTLPPNTSIVDITYNSKKKVIHLECETNKKGHFVQFAFFPKFHISTSPHKKEAIKEILKFYSKKNVKINEEPNKLTILASNFEELKKVKNFLEKNLNLIILLLPAERQFLIENNISYYSKEDGSFSKKFLELKIKFTKQKVKSLLFDLLKEKRGTAEKIVEKLILSNILSIPAKYIPDQQKQITELWLEKIFFKNKFDPPNLSTRETYQRRYFNKRTKCENVSEVNFAFVWPSLMTYPFNNIGFESMNCICCKPNGLNGKNLSPASIIKVKCNGESVYIPNSLHKKYSEKFHETMPGKMNREKLKSEFYLPNYPLGPFSRNDEALIPLADFKTQDSKLFEFLSEHKMNWFCERHESFLSKEINTLQAKMHLVQDKIDLIEKEYLEKYKIFKDSYLQFSVEHLFLTKKKELIEKILHNIPEHLLAESSKFYKEEISNSIQVIQNETLHNFQKFTQELGKKIISRNKNSVFIQDTSASGIAKKFSNELNIPDLKIKKVHSFTYV